MHGARPASWTRFRTAAEVLTVEGCSAPMGAAAPILEPAILWSRQEARSLTLVPADLARPVSGGHLVHFRPSVPALPRPAWCLPSIVTVPAAAPPPASSGIPAPELPRPQPAEPLPPTGSPLAVEQLWQCVWAQSRQPETAPRFWCCQAPTLAPPAPSGRQRVRPQADRRRPPPQPQADRPTAERPRTPQRSGQRQLRTRHSARPTSCRPVGPPPPHACRLVVTAGPTRRPTAAGRPLPGPRCAQPRPRAPARPPGGEWPARRPHPAALRCARSRPHVQVFGCHAHLFQLFPQAAPRAEQQRLHRLQVQPQHVCRQKIRRALQIA